jgi:hypothetical protein
MKPLIAYDSSLYLKRMVRELNAIPDGFYTSNGTRCNRARLFFGDLLQVRKIGGGWKTPPDHRFCDAYGRDVYASRTP